MTAASGFVFSGRLEDRRLNIPIFPIIPRLISANGECGDLGINLSFIAPGLLYVGIVDDKSRQDDPGCPGAPGEGYATTDALQRYRPLIWNVLSVI
jgi:hypothetical protein